MKNSWNEERGWLHGHQTLRLTTVKVSRDVRFLRQEGNTEVRLILPGDDRARGLPIPPRATLWLLRGVNIETG